MERGQVFNMLTPEQQIEIRRRGRARGEGRSGALRSENMKVGDHT